MMSESCENREIRIDTEGIWYFQGEEMTRRDIVLYFYQHLKRDTHGHYLIEIEDDRCPVSVEDVPYVVRSAAVICSKNDGQPCIELTLTDGSSEELASNDTPLWTGDDNVLYCTVKGGEHTARFSRPAYYQLCEYAAYDPEKEQHSINIPNRSYPVAASKQP